MSKKNALILTASGYSDEELLYCYYRLTEDEFNIKICSDVISSTQNPKPLKGINGLSLHSDYSYNDSFSKQFFLENFNFLVLIGGVKSLEKIRQQRPIISFIKDWNEEGKVIASICHGTQLLIEADIIKDRKISGYYSIQKDIENAGATYSDQPAVVDNNIISTAHYKHLGPWMKKALDVYYEKNFPKII